MRAGICCRSASVESRIPEPLEIGRIGAGGTGHVIARLCRRDGDAPPVVSVRGAYTDAGGVAQAF